MKKFTLLIIVGLILSACQPNIAVPSKPTQASTVVTVTPDSAVMPLPVTQVSTTNKIPDFDHIVLTVLENRNYDQVMGSPQMPYLHALAQQFVQLSNYYAVRHPSLPNYIALMSGGSCLRTF